MVYYLTAEGIATMNIQDELLEITQAISVLPEKE